MVSVPVSLTTETPRTRPFSVVAENSKFSDQVRARDKRCCISGVLVDHDDFVGFDVVQIFPQGETDTCDIDDLPEQNSIQQGFLCGSTERALFDDYSIGVNPDDNYRIYNFVARDSRRSPHGKIFYRNPDAPEHCLPSPDLLRDHFRQCVLRRVKGIGQSQQL